MVCDPFWDLVRMQHWGREKKIVMRWTEFGWFQLQAIWMALNLPIKKWLSSQTKMHPLAASKSSSKLFSIAASCSSIICTVSRWRKLRNLKGAPSSTFPAHSKILSNNAIWRQISAKSPKRKHCKWWARTLICNYLSSSSFFPLFLLLLQWAAAMMNTDAKTTKFFVVGTINVRFITIISFIYLVNSIRLVRPHNGHKFIHSRLVCVTNMKEYTRHPKKLYRYL